MQLLIAHGGAQQVQVFAQGRRGRPVVTCQEFVHQFAVVLIGVPQELGHEPGSEFTKVADGRKPVGVLEKHADRAVLTIEPDVGSENREPRLKREGVLAKVGRVVPDGQPVGRLGPGLQVVPERHVVSVADGLHG